MSALKPKVVLIEAVRCRKSPEIRPVYLGEVLNASVHADSRSDAELLRFDSSLFVSAPLVFHIFLSHSQGEVGMYG